MYTCIYLSLIHILFLPLEEKGRKNERKGDDVRDCAREMKLKRKSKESECERERNKRSRVKRVIKCS